MNDKYITRGVFKTLGTAGLLMAGYGLGRVVESEPNTSIYIMGGLALKGISAYNLYMMDRKDEDD